MYVCMYVCIHTHIYLQHNIKQLQPHIYIYNCVCVSLYIYICIQYIINIIRLRTLLTLTVGSKALSPSDRV